MAAWGKVAQELLEFLLWTTELSTPMRLLNQPMQPDWGPSGRQIKRLANQQLVAQEQRAQELVCQLTELGRLRALGGRDPEACWRRPWDGQWRMVIFDLPQHQHALRRQFLRWLRQNGFGYLQNSVWVHPDSLPALTDALVEFRDDVESMVVMESRCFAGYSDIAIVEGAWDFAEINRRYQRHQAHAKNELSRQLTPATTTSQVWQRLHQERTAWATAVTIDPLLPTRLLPVGYLGQVSWDLHRAAMHRLCAHLAGSRLGI